MDPSHSQVLCNEDLSCYVRMKVLPPSSCITQQKLEHYPHQDPIKGENGLRNKCTIGIGKDVFSNLQNQAKLVHR